jgi:hypothetical protein
MKFLVMLLVFTVTTGAFAVAKDCTSNDKPRTVVADDKDAQGNVVVDPNKPSTATGN